MDRLRPGATVEVSTARPEIKPPPEAARKGRGKGAGKGDGKGGKKAE
jgi:hypothetical protein